MITSLLPQDIIVDVLARVPRCRYPVLSLVSKHFHSIVTSSEIYTRRSLLGCTEPCLYSLLYNQETKENRLYILHRNRLVLVPSLQAIPSSVNFFLGGSKIYMLGALYNYFTSIDCKSHMVQYLPKMPKGMIYTVADIIGKKIYVLGTRNSNYNILVFNTETQMWESEMTKLDMEIGYQWPQDSVVIGDKMYMRNSSDSFVYMPKGSKLEKDEKLNFNSWKNACVINDILYYNDYYEKKLRAYDTKQRRWEVVNGLESLPDAAYCSKWSNTVNYGEKLVLLFKSSCLDGKIWCAEIALERRQGGEIWGKFESCDVVIEGRDFFLEKSLVVML